MESGVVMVGTAAIAYYVYSRTRRDLSSDIVETHRHVEQAPRNWTGELYLFAEGLRYLYLEYITRWQSADLFIGLFYLARQGIRDFPAAEVVAHGTRIDPNTLDASHLRSLKNKFEVMYRLLLYSQKLRNTSEEIPVEEWMDLEICQQDFVVYRPKASVLCPAYVIVKDHVLNCFVLAIRGTHSTRDIFTSLSGAAKPHHYVDNHGAVLGYSHFGMLAGARWIFKNCKQILCSAHEQQPGFKLVITGHSMGGGAAAMLTMMIREQLSQFADAQCYTFACPSCMTLEIARSCAPYVTTLVYGNSPTVVLRSVSQASQARMLYRRSVLEQEISSEKRWSSHHGVNLSSRISGVGLELRRRAAGETVVCRSSPIVQGIENRMRGMYRSASTWTLSQARTVSSLTTSCVRPRNQGANPSTTQSCPGDGHTQTMDDASTSNALESVPDVVEISRSLEKVDIADAHQTKEGIDQDKNTTRPSSNGRSSYLSEIWSKMPSFSWRRRVSAVETLVTGEEVEAGDNDVEGVFNAQGIEDDTEGDSAAASSSTNANSNAKRLLYPAGRIFHLVPEYILKADPSRGCSTMGEESEEGVHAAATAADPRDRPNEQHCQEEDAHGFVLFSDMPQEAYGKIRVCRSMVMDHYLPRYKIALNSAIQDLESGLEHEKTQCI